MIEAIIFTGKVLSVLFGVAVVVVVLAGIFIED